MTPSRPLITLDLRAKALEDLARLELEDRKAALKALRIIRGLDMVGLGHHAGLNWESLDPLTDKTTGKILWSFRFGSGARALCIKEPGSVIVVATFQPDHDKAYRRR
jgi:hypothetical protein